MTLDKKLTCEELTSEFTREETNGTMMYRAKVRDIRLEGNSICVFVSGQAVLECYRKKRSDTLGQRIVNFLFENERGKWETQWHLPGSDNSYYCIFLSADTNYPKLMRSKAAATYGAGFKNGATRRGIMLDNGLLNSVFRPIVEQMHDLYNKKAPKIYDEMRSMVERYQG